VRELRIVDSNESLFVVGAAEDLRRGQSKPIIGSTNHKDAVRIKQYSRNATSRRLHGRPRLELHRLEIEHLCVFTIVT